MSRIAFSGLVLLCFGVALYAAQYWSGWTFIPGFQPVVNNLGVTPLAVHAGFGSVALVLGPFQFSSRLRAARPGVHRMTGRVYIAACLISGLAGLVLAIGSQGGPVAQAGFFMLAVFWLWTTISGLRAAMARRIPEHRRWMWRSMALTFAAVTLRLQLPIAFGSGYDFSVAYPVIAWSCWVPNLVVVEIGLRLQSLFGRQRAAS